MDLGEKRHQVWILRDLTRQRAAEAERQALERDLQQAQKLEALGSMAGGVAHEINTPVQFIGANIAFLRDGFGDLLAVMDAYRSLRVLARSGADLGNAVTEIEKAEDDANLDGLIADIPEALSQSEEGIARVSKIVRAIKQFAHAGSDVRAMIEVNKAIDGAIELCRGAWSSFGDLKTHYEDDLPPIVGDAGLFTQVMQRLITNAAQAIRQAIRQAIQQAAGKVGDPTIERRNSLPKGRIDIRTGYDGQHVSIEVRDNGCGVPADLHDRIFEPFFTTKEVGKGAGQGLALCCKTVTEAFGGVISLSSEEGRGARFTLRIPTHKTS